MPRSMRTRVADEAVARLRETVRGRIIGPDQAEYHASRQVFYSGYDRRPAALVQVADARDVAAVLSTARETGLELAVRSGGHSVAGHGVSDGGLVLDVSGMASLDLDVEGRSAWAGAGLTTGAYTKATGEHGLATGFGDAPTVGLGGITLAGGIGFLHRKLGLTIDSLLGAELVLADGRMVRTDAESNPDLFWAIRGGGGNFGVVTRLRFRLHEVATIVGGLMMLPATPDLVVSLLEQVVEAEEDLSSVVNVMTAPPMPMIPAEHHGKPVVMAMLAHTGDAEAGERAMARIRGLAAPILDGVQRMPYPAIYEGPEGPHPAAIVVRSFFMDRVDRVAAERILERLQAATAPMRVVQFRAMGGAVARVPADATAFAHRDRRFMVSVAAAYELLEQAPEHAVWATDLAAELRQGEPGAYVGFLGAEGEGRVREAYPGRTWARLRQVKTRYDPDNLFRLNQNIQPGPRPVG